MPVSERILRGPHLVSSSVPVETTFTEYVYTRKKKRTSGPPLDKDTIAWRWDSLGRSELVFRSPIDSHTWITATERRLLIATLLHEDVPFTTRKGYTPVCHPVKGMTAWFRVPELCYRRHFEFDGEVWVPVKRGESL